jgi:Fe-S oxidoreductase
MPEVYKVALDVTNINNFTYDMAHCIKCKGCQWVDHIYMPGMKFSTKCPSATKEIWDSYGAYGKVRIGLAMAEGKLEYTPELLKIIYECSLCGACDTGCKRNLDLEIELSLEAMRVKAVKDGAGPMPEHKKVAANIAKTHNRYGAKPEERRKWLPSNTKVAAKANVLYFPGCSTSYKHPEIGKSVVKIFEATKTPFTMLADEWCCGNVLYSVGMIDEARKLAKRNIDAIKASGAQTVVCSCAECYRMIKVDYPKILGTNTSDLGFEVLHITEFADKQLSNGTLKLGNRFDINLHYHDSCSLSRQSEPWTSWSGERGLWGCVSPNLERRRGTNGVWAAPRNLLSAIPGVKIIEGIRKRENNWCCGAGRGAKDAFPEFAKVTADAKLVEVKEIGAEAIVAGCPYCKENLGASVGLAGENIKVMDISEVIAQAIVK